MLPAAELGQPEGGLGVGVGGRTSLGVQGQGLSSSSSRVGCPV